MFYTIYKITNNVNGKYYIGKHQTKDLNDGYMGSGKFIKRAIEKYGVKNFTKEIIHVFDNEKDMNDKEKELVVVSEETYNLCPGGEGGFGYINENKLNGFHKKDVAKRAGYTSGNKSFFLKIGIHKLTNEEKRIAGKQGAKITKERYPNGTFKDKKHSEETKQKMSLKAKQRLTDPTKNSQYGSCWITNGKENRKIKKDIDIIPEGWYNGRILNIETCP